MMFWKVPGWGPQDVGSIAGSDTTQHCDCGLISDHGADPELCPTHSCHGRELLQWPSVVEWLA